MSNPTYTSCINWFSSKGQNFGFIVKPENLEAFFRPNYNLRNDYRVDDSDIEKELLEFLYHDQSFGKGIHVEFNLNDAGNRAINVKLKQYIGIVKGIDSLPSRNQNLVIERENYKQLPYYSKGAKEGDCVIFGMRNQAVEKIQVLQCNATELCFYLNSPHPTILLYSIIANLKHSKLSFAEAESKIFTKPTLLQSTQFWSKLSLEFPALLIHSYDLRKYWQDITHYSQFINKYLDYFDREEILAELEYRLLHTNTSEQNEYWQRIPFLQENLEFNGDLWDIAPLEYKTKKIQETYKSFFSLTEQFANSDYPHEDKTTGDWRKLYFFNSSEIKLIESWIEVEVYERDYQKQYVQMIAARGAEKLVFRYYELLGYTVKDISLQQIHNYNDFNWRYGDITITKGNIKRLLDVKNARKAVNSNLYSELRVKPKHNQEFYNKVSIIGVLSPRVSSDEITSLHKRE